MDPFVAGVFIYFGAGASVGLLVILGRRMMHKIALDEAKDEETNGIWARLGQDFDLSFTSNHQDTEVETSLLLIKRRLGGHITGGKLRIRSSNAGENPLNGRLIFEPPLNLGLNLTHRSVWSPTKGTVTGDKDFDKAFKLTASDPVGAASRLKPATRRALLKIHAMVHQFEANDTEITWGCQKEYRTDGELRALLDATIMLSRDLQSH